MNNEGPCSPSRLAPKTASVSRTRCIFAWRTFSPWNTTRICFSLWDDECALPISWHLDCCWDAAFCQERKKCVSLSPTILEARNINSLVWDNHKENEPIICLRRFGNTRFRSASFSDHLECCIQYNSCFHLRSLVVYRVQIRQIVLDSRWFVRWGKWKTWYVQWPLPSVCFYALSLSHGSLLPQRFRA